MKGKECERISPGCIFALRNEFISGTLTVQLFGGFSYLHAEQGAALWVQMRSSQLTGWNRSIAIPFNSWLGVVADFSAHKNGTTTIQAPNIGSQRIDYDAGAFLFGPQFTLRKNKKLVPFGRFSLGAIRLGGVIGGSSSQLDQTTWNYPSE